MAPGKRKPKAVITELPSSQCAFISEERQRWLHEGRCPTCGELGAFVALGAVCSQHGPYEMQPEISRADTSPEDWLQEKE
jgi:hypothetical protein